MRVQKERKEVGLARQTAQWRKALAAEPDKRGLMRRTPMVEERELTPESRPLTSTHGTA